MWRVLSIRTDALVCGLHLMGSIWLRHLDNVETWSSFFMNTENYIAFATNIGLGGYELCEFKDNSLSGSLAYIIV